MLVATLRWRDEFDVEAACNEKFPQDIFGSLGHIYGHDKQGHPVVYVYFNFLEAFSGYSAYQKVQRVWW